MKSVILWFKTESAGGMAMMAAAALALLAANSPWSGHYQTLVGPLTMPVNDVLMVFFFLLIGMELKGEMTTGVLADKRQILLPMVAAIGGMVVPALLFLAMNIHAPDHWNGWAIASATDIAFALCVLSLVCKSVPPALKIFLLAVAIFDDLGAILIIALFYSHGIALAPLAGAAGVILALFLLGRFKVASALPYFLLMAALGYLLHEGGIHTTLAGVITGLAIPSKCLDDFMHRLHPWVNFAILPIFAFTAAGVDLRGMNTESLFSSLPLSIALGLFIGKQIGIFGAGWFCIKLGFAKLPADTSWRQFYGVSVIAGIGFTMSLFIGLLAFHDAALQEQAKIGVIMGSLLAALWGWVVLGPQVKPED